MRRRRMLLLAAGVAAVVLVCLRPFGDGPDPDPPPPPAAPPPAAGPPVPPRLAGDSATPGATTDPHPPHAEEDHPDGLVTGEEDLAPADVPAAVRAAEAFATAWSTPDPDWPEPVTGLATPDLAATLEGTSSPAAGDVTGAGYLVLDAPEWARVGVPTEHGTVLLDVTLVDGQWLVSALDWWPREAGSPGEGP